jgi:hypothetical protein
VELAVQIGICPRSVEVYIFEVAVIRSLEHTIDGKLEVIFVSVYLAALEIRDYCGQFTIDVHGGSQVARRRILQIMSSSANLGVAPETAPREFLSELVLKQCLLPHIVVLNAINLPAVAFKGTDWTQFQATCGGILGTPLEEAAASRGNKRRNCCAGVVPLLAGVNTCCV